MCKIIFISVASKARGVQYFCTALGCLSVCDLYVSSLSVGDRKKKIGSSDRGVSCPEFCEPDFFIFV